MSLRPPTQGTPSTATFESRITDLGLNVKSYGAAGDGTTDDTTAVAAAFSAGIGKQVHFPPGNYVLSSVQLPYDCQIHAPLGVTFTHKPGSTNPIFYHPQSPRTLLWRFTIEGNPVFQGEPWTVNGGAESLRCGVFITYGRRIDLGRSEFYDFKSAGAHCQDCLDVTYDGLRAERCGNSGGRNALEIMGTDNFADTTDVAAEWTMRNCKADMAGASGGGAGGICAVAKNAQNIRAHIDGNIGYNALWFAGIVVEAGFSKYSTVSHNKAFCCKTGIFQVDTSGEHGSTVVIDRNVFSGNIVDCKNVTTNTPTDGVTTVVPGADLPGAVGIDCLGSHTILEANVIRSSADGLKLRSNPSTGVKATASGVHNNEITICNQNAALSVFGIVLTGLVDPNVSGNHVEREAGATMKDAYYLSDIDGLTWGDNSSRGAGRSAVKIAQNVTNATFNGGQHIDPASNEAANGFDVTATGCSDLHFGGGMRIKDTRGGSATMTNGISFSAAIANSDTGELVILGWVTSAISGNTNVAVDQRRLYCQETVPKSWGQAGNRYARTTAAAWAARTGSWTRGDRCEYNDPSAAGFFGEVITTSGTPGTSKTYAPITA